MNFALPHTLSLQKFGVAFADRVILHSVDLSLPAKGCTVLLGPSGTGKSTLLRTLAGFNDSNPALRTWGTALYDGIPMTSHNRPVLLMQKSTLLISNVLENLVCALPNRSSLTKSLQIELLMDVLARYGLSRLQDVLPQKMIELNVETQRMIGILRMTISNPALVMIDEPTADLDPIQAESILTLIERIREERSVLVVLHNLLQARRLGEQIVLLANRVVQEQAESGKFFSNPSSLSAKAFLRTGSCPEDAHSDNFIAAHLSERRVVTSSATALTKRISSACGPNGFRWLLPDRLGGMPRPGLIHDIRYDFDAVKAVGVTHLVSLTENAVDTALAGEFGINWLSSPIPDMAPPTVAQAVSLCRMIDELISRSQTVAIHCLAGLGRTGTVLAAYWIWAGKGNINALQALEFVRRIESGWVQSDRQLEFLEKFALIVANERPQTSASYDPFSYSPSRDLALQTSHF
jgi:atypical dual specificity phosphatase